MKYQSKAVRLADDLIRDIQSGDFASLRMLPGEEALAERYDVSRNTIRRAIELLGHDGFVIRKPHSGTEISPKAKLRRRSDYFGITIAFAYASYPDGLLTSLKSGMLHYCEDHRINLQLFTSPHEHHTVLEMVRNAARFGVQGIILFPFPTEEYRLAAESAMDSGVELVTIAEVPELACSTVCGDDFSATYLGVQKLIAIHNRPCYFFAPEPLVRYDNDCSNAFRLAMHEAGFGDQLEKYLVRMKLDASDPACWPMEQKTVRQRLECLRILPTLKQPASIFCLDNYIAHGLYLAAAELNLKIGRDLFVIAKDNLPLAERLDPPLTTLYFNIEEMGYQAAHIVHQHITSHIRERISLKIPTRLIERQSERVRPVN